MRKEIIAGNWKMYKTVSETEEYFKAYIDRLNVSEREVMLFTPFTSLNKALELTENTHIRIGAQNVHFEDFGAFTGEISAPMLKDIGIDLVLIGHSERRKYYAETNETVNLKVKKALSSGLLPMMCIGETLEEREADKTFSVLYDQLKVGLEGVNDKSIVIAYEPVWAIGTGKTATDEQAEEVCAYIRDTLRDMYGDNADEIRILYGGSVNKTNIKGIMAQKNIDGVLVGGASLKEDFTEIVNYD